MLSFKISLEITHFYGIILTFYESSAGSAWIGQKGHVGLEKNSAVRVEQFVHRCGVVGENDEELIGVRREHLVLYFRIVFGLRNSACVRKACVEL